MRILLAILLVHIQFAYSFNDLDYPEILTPSETIEVLWSEYLSAELDPVRFFSLTEGLHLKETRLRDQLRILQMRNSFLGGEKSSFSKNDLDPESALRIASEKIHYSRLNLNFGKLAVEKLDQAKRRLEEIEKFRPKTREEIVDLVFEAPDLNSYQDGQYADGVKLFLFCRHDRSYPCLFTMKDVHDRLVRNESGALWTLPALAKSARGLPYHITNGYTPSGVHSIDSVMPQANRQISFGKFRRVILNWIPTDESTMNLLPNSAKTRTWWRAASLARDNGRKWLRIHGTGRVNQNPSSNYYPHMPTSGCVSTREGKYGNVEYKDQRKMLDSLMKASLLAPVYANEPRIKGIMYVIELDDKKSKVTPATLEEYGIR